MQDSITTLTARQITVPLESPVWLGGAAVRERVYCLVEITTADDGLGHALAFTRGADLVTPLIQQFAPLLLQQNPDEVERLWERLYEATRLNSRQGAWMRALSLIDLALWDLKAKRAGLPLHRLLGGYRSSIPVMMAGGYYHADKDLPALCEEFLGYAAEGYRHLKLIVGGATMEEDLARFVVVRNCLPPEIDFGIDANGAWTDPKAVLQWVQQCQAKTSGVAFIEEPLPPENRSGLAWLRNASPVPVAVGEFLSGRWTFHEYLSEGCMDIVRADATLCGGISEWKKIAALANAANRPLMPHYFASIHFHLALALPGCSRIEVVSREGRNSSFHLLAGQSYRLEKGMAHPTGRPGLGLELDREFINRHTTHELTTP